MVERKKVIIRNPQATRPWQHVLEVLNGYLKLASFLKKNKKFHGQAFNFGPQTNKNYSVIEVLKNVKKLWKISSWTIKKDKKFFENTLLQLNSEKAKKIIKWKPILNFKDNIKLTVEWYKQYSMNKKSISKKTLEQINFYTKILKRKKISMKVVILAGGMGTRLQEYTKTIPKPMVKIKKIPIIIHIMRHYAKYGFNEFIIATGYKSKFIEKFLKKNQRLENYYNKYRQKYYDRWAY